MRLVLEKSLNLTWPCLYEPCLIPAQKFTFIRMEFLTHQNIVRVPADRVKIILSKQFSLRLKFCHELFFLFWANSLQHRTILLGRLHLRPLQVCLLSVWKPHILPLDHQVTINSMIKFHLKWWMDTNRFIQGMPIRPPDPNIFLYTDASHFGWELIWNR